MKGIGTYVRTLGDTLENMGLAFQSPFGHVEKRKNIIRERERERERENMCDVNSFDFS